MKAEYNKYLRALDLPQNVKLPEGCTEEEFLQNVLQARKLDLQVQSRLNKENSERNYNSLSSVSKKIEKEIMSLKQEKLNQGEIKGEAESKDDIVSKFDQMFE
jgi:hypothetical protein